MPEWSNQEVASEYQCQVLVLNSFVNARRFRLAMDASSDAIWDWNLVNGSSYFSPAYYRMLGYENNLDRSPRLAELTLTIPDGPLILPVIRTPRAGGATIGSALMQWAYALAPTTVLRSGLNLNARTAASDHATDWQQTQWTTEAVHSGTWWRAHADASVVWVGGKLNEPYRLNRAGLSAEALGERCRARLAYVHEQRIQSVTETLDASTALWVADFHCPLPGLPDWQASLSISRGRDRPKSTERPGGPQDLRATGFRVVGPLGLDTRLDLNLRYVQVRDSTGYNVLLEGNAIRQFGLGQLSVEWSHRMDAYGWPGWTLALQWQAARQSSNLKLFAYRADNVYGGLRFSW